MASGEVAKGSSAFLTSVLGLRPREECFLTVAGHLSHSFQRFWNLLFPFAFPHCLRLTKGVVFDQRQEAPIAFVFPLIVAVDSE
jgi:hypothetical protein